MIYEDVYLDNNRYLHTLRSKEISSKKENIIFIHGFIGSNTNFIGLMSIFNEKI